MSLLQDLSVAFDTVDHSILPDWLENQFGIFGLAVVRGKSNLSERTVLIIVIDNFWCEMWCTPGLCSWTSSVLFIYFNSLLNYTHLWITLPFLCWRYSSVLEKAGDHAQIINSKACLSSGKSWMSPISIYFLPLISDKIEMLIICPVRHRHQFDHVPVIINYHPSLTLWFL